MDGKRLKIKILIIVAVGLAAAAAFVAFIFVLNKYSERKAREMAVAREVTVTIPEGLNVRQIGDILDKSSLFPAKSFVDLAAKEEGYLFPDTYRFYKDSKPEDVIVRMREHFFSKFTPELLAEADAKKRTLKEVVTMASILEEEVQSTEDRKIVAGILWKRMSLGMGLNVDSALTYILGKTSAELTDSDLKLKSPYNTYVNRGLPPTPISNPGMDALLAALRPAETKYFYYLSGKDGTTHYAVTLEEHVLNKRRYLR